MIPGDERRAYSYTALPRQSPTLPPTSKVRASQGARLLQSMKRQQEIVTCTAASEREQVQYLVRRSNAA